jgi:hypothetical protein
LRGLSGFNLPLIKFGALSKLLFVGRNGKSSKDDGAEIFKTVVKEVCEKIKGEKAIVVQVSGGREGGEGAWRVGGEGARIVFLLTPSQAFTINTHRHLINYMMRVETEKRAKERGEGQQADEERENAEQGIAGHNDRMGARYSDTWGYANSTFPYYGDKEVLDLFDLSKRMWNAIGLHTVFTGVITSELGPQQELVRSTKAFRRGQRGDGVLGPRHASVNALVNLGGGGRPSEIRGAVKTFMSSPLFKKIVALALKKEVGRVRAEDAVLKDFQMEGIEELLVGEIGGSGGGNEQVGRVEVGRNLSVQAVCGEGKTLVVTVPALIKQWLLKVVVGGRYFPTIVLYPNVVLCKSAAGSFRSCGLRVVELHHNAIGGGIEEAERIMHNEGSVVICAVVDSFVKPAVLNKVALWVQKGWLRGIVHDEGQEVSGGGGGGGGCSGSGYGVTISLLISTPPFPANHSSSISGV